MAVTFTRAPTVVAGDRITSTQLATLSRAFNSRLRSGLGDGTFRIFYYILSLFTQVRNPDSSGFLWPSKSEFLEFYAHLDPADAQWPASGPGDPEGANLTNPINAFVFGNDAMGLYDEETRLTDPLFGGIPLYIDGHAPATAAEVWQVAKMQRGAYDPANGALGSPAFDAARSFSAIRYSNYSPHGRSYGDWMPSPEILPDACEDPNPADEMPAPVNWEIKFTPTTAGSAKGLTTIIYDGTCQPADIEQYPTHIAGVVYTPWAYYVFLNAGTLQVLPTADYIEGPYTGAPRLRKTDGQQLFRVLNWFIREFRGSTEQRAQPRYHLQDAFDFQAFLATQYFLAPARGTATADLTALTAHYPLFRFHSPQPQGTRASTPGGSSYQYASGFALTHAWVSGALLNGPVTIEILNGSTVIDIIDIVPEADGTVDLVTPLPVTTAPLVSVRLQTDLRMQSSDGSLEIELTELLDYKPETQDAYLLLRCAAAILSAPDGHGSQESGSRSIWESYRDTGAVLNRHGLAGLASHPVTVNDNAVFEAARQMSHLVRCIPRRQFAGYAVVGGKSILWFRRYAMGMSHTVPLDSFHGIAPSRADIPSGELVPGRTYIVQAGGMVTYDGRDYRAGQTFTSLAGKTEYAGGGTVREYDGIRHTADHAGQTNEWLVGFQFKPYHTSDSSILKPDSYSDYWPLVNRCHFYSPEIANDAPLLWHTSYGQRVSGTFGGVLSPESPSGYNYARLNSAWLGRQSVNQIECAPGDTACEQTRLNFYRSCRVYEPDPEIESAVEETEADGTELVKLTLTGRVHHCATAPASIAQDISSWDLPALTAEPYRSVENALRDYLVQQANGTTCPVRNGDNAANSTVQSNPDNPAGSCFPHCLLTKLVPLPYDDANDRQNSHDTPIRHDVMSQMELYLRAMCEGYVDGVTSADYACAYGSYGLYAFSYENLCMQALSSPWFKTLPSSIRADAPRGFGPLPNTICYAEVFNQFSSAINLLTRCRVMLPFTIECRTASGSATRDATGALWPAGVECVGTGDIDVVWKGQPPDAPVGAYSAWSDCGAEINVVSSARILDTCNGTAFQISTDREIAQYQVTLVGDAVQAVPESWRDQIASIGGFLVQLSTYRDRACLTPATDASDALECRLPGDPPDTNPLWDYGANNGWKLCTDGFILQNTTECLLLDAGAIDPGTPAAGAFHMMRHSGGRENHGISLSQIIVTIQSDPGFYVSIPLV